MSAPLSARVLIRRFSLYHNIVKRCIGNKAKSNDVKLEMKIADRLFEVRVGELAMFANGSAVAKYGDTSVLVTAVSKQTLSYEDFIPLTVDYQQKMSAAGRIPMNYFRREVGPTEKEVLTSRIIDRSLRPLFPKGVSPEIQIVCNLLAVDDTNDPDIVSINAASAALMISSIPWNGPVAAVRVGFIDSEIVINPTQKQKERSSLDLTLACTESSIVMIEAAGDSVPRSTFCEALKLGMVEAQRICKKISQLSQIKGKAKEELKNPDEVPKEVADEVKRCCTDDINKIFFDHTLNKTERGKLTSLLRLVTVDEVLCTFPDVDENIIKKAFDQLYRETFRKHILTKGIRHDGRRPDDLRPIQCEVDLYKPLHGSALFQRGQTQVFCTVTFDSPRLAAKIDDFKGGFKEKNFMLHYEFPPYATNEVGKVGGRGNRREIGHGALAEKALLPLIPKDYPFTIRLTSEVLASAGSSSMASVCGGSMALMDAGVPILEPAAGVAIGLVSDQKIDPHTWKTKDYRLLTDIQGLEDYFGDMDFKIAGTMKGITALQADIKQSGLPLKVVTEAVKQGIDAYTTILLIMKATIKTPRESLKDCGPVTKTYQVSLMNRPKFVGIGGYNIKMIFNKTGVTIDSIDETHYQIFAPNQDAMTKAMEMIEHNLQIEDEPELEAGGIYKVRISEIREKGVMVQIHPRMQPQFIPTTQLDVRKVDHPFALELEEGQEITVKYFGRDPVTGKMRLSRKVLQITSQKIRKMVDSSPTNKADKS